MQRQNALRNLFLPKYKTAVPPPDASRPDPVAAELGRRERRLPAGAERVRPRARDVRLPRRRPAARVRPALRAQAARAAVARAAAGGRHAARHAAQAQVPTHPHALLPACCHLHSDPKTISQLTSPGISKKR